MVYQLSNAKAFLEWPLFFLALCLCLNFVLLVLLWLFYKHIVTADVNSQSKFKSWDSDLPKLVLSRTGKRPGKNTLAPWRMAWVTVFLSIVACVGIAYHQYNIGIGVLSAGKVPSSRIYGIYHNIGFAPYPIPSYQSYLILAYLIFYLLCYVLGPTFILWRCLVFVRNFRESGKFRDVVLSGYSIRQVLASCFLVGGSRSFVFLTAATTILSALAISHGIFAILRNWPTTLVSIQLTFIDFFWGFGPDQYYIGVGNPFFYCYVNNAIVCHLMATIILGFLLFAFLVNNIPFENAFHYTILLSAIYSISFVGPQFRAILDPTFGVWEYPLAYRPRIGSNLYLIPFELKKDGGLLKYTWLYYKLIFFTLFCCSALWLWLRANDAQSEHAEEGNVWLL